MYYEEAVVSRLTELQGSKEKIISLFYQKTILTDDRPFKGEKK